MSLRRLRLRINDESQDGKGQVPIPAPIFCETGRSTVTISWDGVSADSFHLSCICPFPVPIPSTGTA